MNMVVYILLTCQWSCSPVRQDYLHLSDGDSHIEEHDGLSCPDNVHCGPP